MCAAPSVEDASASVVEAAQQQPQVAEASVQQAEAAVEAEAGVAGAKDEGEQEHKEADKEGEGVAQGEEEGRFDTTANAGATIVLLVAPCSNCVLTRRLFGYVCSQQLSQA
jgi:hypothetical protein